MEEDEPVIVRIGTFFLLIGIGVFVIFIASDFGDKADFDYFFVAVLLIFIGWVFRRRKPPPASAGRFAYLNKMRENAKNKREEKLKGKQDAKK